MAGPLAAVERFFERMFERPAARLFQARLEPVHIQRGLERAMEAERRMHSRRAYVPSDYRVLLNERDLATLTGERQVVLRDLADAVRAYARARNYTLTARPRVEIQGSAAVPAGDVRVYAEPVVLREPIAMSPAAASDVEHAAGQTTSANGAAEGAAQGDMSQATSVYPTPATNAPRAQLAVRAPGQAATRIPVRAGTIRVGRALDNDVVLSDDRVSRHHGQFGVRLGMLVYTDLGSTNGSYLSGSAVTEIALGPGDVLQLGSSTVTIEPAP